MKAREAFSNHFLLEDLTHPLVDHEDSQIYCQESHPRQVKMA